MSSMAWTEDGECLLPADDGLFADTFSEETVYKFIGQEVKINQVFSANLGVAAPVWDSALLLCRYFENHTLDLRGKRIIELGAGTGIVGILASLLGAEVTLTDLPLAVPQLQKNVSANRPTYGWLSIPPSVVPLSWGEDHLSFPCDWDLVLGADIVYLSEAYPLLIETLVHLCKNGAVLYLSSKMRTEHGTPTFYEESLPDSFHVELVHRDSKQNINIYKASLKAGQT